MTINYDTVLDMHKISQSRRDKYIQRMRDLKWKYYKVCFCGISFDTHKELKQHKEVHRI